MRDEVRISRPAGPFQWEGQPSREVAPGVVVQLIHAGGMTILRGHYDQGAVVALHSHPHEQLTWVLSGALAVEVDGEITTVRSGEVAHVPGGLPHEATALEETEFAEVFNPVREDLRAS